MAKKKSKLDVAVARTAEIFEAHMNTLSPAQAKAMRKDVLHSLCHCDGATLPGGLGTGTHNCFPSPGAFGGSTIAPGSTLDLWCRIPPMSSRLITWTKDVASSDQFGFACMQEVTTPDNSGLSTASVSQ